MVNVFSLALLTESVYPPYVVREHIKRHVTLLGIPASHGCSDLCDAVKKLILLIGPQYFKHSKRVQLTKSATRKQGQWALVFDSNK